MIRTTGIDHVHLHVVDAERAVRFYHDVFGAEESFRVGDALIFLKLPEGGSVIVLDGRPEHERNPEHVGLALGAQDLGSAIADVERAGGRLLERGEMLQACPMRTCPIRTATCSSSDGAGTALG